MTGLEAVIPAAASRRFLFRRQGSHLLFLIALLAVAQALARPALGDADYLGLSTGDWFLVCLAIPVAHQAWVWLGWRLQLGWGVFTRLFGRHDLTVFCVIFFPLLLARPLSVLALGLSDGGSLDMDLRLAVGLAVVLAVPALYTMYSIHRWFHPVRAAGADHFRTSYRSLPLVAEGAFAWSPNAMYTFGFLGLSAIALALRSHAALIAALYSHAYIWLHYLCTEQPDMELIYGQKPESAACPIPR